MKPVLMMLVLVALLVVPAASGQEWSADQQEVWKVVEWTWEIAPGRDWCAEVCHPNLLAWGNDTPAPRNREQIQKWWKRNQEATKDLEVEVTPIGIAVQGDTAVAHYYYSQMSEDQEGKRTTDHGRYTDVLVKEDGKWVYFTWSGGQIDD